MARQYFGIGQVVYGKYKDHAVFVNNEKTYLVIGIGGDKYTDPKVEEVLSVETVSDYKLILQSEANANSSGVFNATFWFGFGAGLLASQMGKHMEYTVEITYTSKEKSHIVLINEGYQILVGSMTIGTPELKQAQARLENTNKRRKTLLDSISSQLAVLERSNRALLGFNGSAIVQSVREQIKLHTDYLEKLVSKINATNDDQLFSISVDRARTNQLAEKTEKICSAYRQYENEYREKLESITELETENKVVTSRIQNSKQEKAKSKYKTALICFLIAVLLGALSLFVMKDGDGLGTVLGILNLITTLVLLLLSISALKEGFNIKKSISQNEKTLLSQRR